MKFTNCELYRAESIVFVQVVWEFLHNGNVLQDSYRTMSAQKGSSQDTRTEWREIIQLLYPDALSRTYCVPPIHFNLLPLAIENVAGEQVFVLQPLDSVPPPPIVPPASQPSGGEPPPQTVAPTSRPSNGEPPPSTVAPTSQPSSGEPFPPTTPPTSQPSSGEPLLKNIPVSYTHLTLPTTSRV